MCWKDFPEMVVANIYPDILIHFLLADTINFSTLAEYASYLATPKFRDNIQRILYQLAERLSDQRDLNSEDEKAATDAYALFFKQMHTLVASGIISKEDLSAIFIRVLLVALHNKAFFLEIISFIKGDANLSEAELRDIFAQVIISALEHKVPIEKIIHFMEEVNKEFHIDVKRQCADLLQKAPYTHYAQLNKLLGCLVGARPVKEDQTVIMIERDELKEIIEAQAKKLMESNSYTAYLRLIRLSDSALRMKIDLYDRHRNEALMRGKREAVASFLGSFSSINPERIKCFESLKAASVKGDAYASFALMELYYKGHAITQDGKSRIEDRALAFIYASIAAAQAKALDNPDLITEIQSFLGANARILCLEELYYTYLLRLLKTPVDSKDYPLVMETFLLIITSVDLEMVFDHVYESSNKTAVQKLIEQCCSKKDLDKAEALLGICALMQEKGAYIQSSGGNARAADPRNLSTAVRYNLHYQWLLAELKKIALLKPLRITSQDIFLRLRQAAGAEGSKLGDNLKHVYKHLFEDFLYDKAIHQDDEALTQLFKWICEKEQVSLNIVTPNVSFIVESDKHIAKGKEKEDSKGKEKEDSKEKESENGVIIHLQRFYATLSEQLNAYPNMRSVFSDMNDILTEMIGSDVYTEPQIQSFCGLLEVIKIVVNEDQEITDELKQEVNGLAHHMLAILRSTLGRIGDESNAPSSSDDVVWSSKSAASGLGDAAPSSSSAALNSRNAPAGFFVQRNLKGQPYTRSMRSSRRSDVDDSHANPLSTAACSSSSSIRSSRRSDVDDSRANPVSTPSSSHLGIFSSMRSSRRSDVSDSRSTFIHSASSSSSSSNPPSFLAHSASSSSSSSNPPDHHGGTTIGSRFINTLSSGLGTLLATPASQRGGGRVEEPLPIPVNIDEVLSDLVDPHRDYGAAIARPLTGIVPVEGHKKIALIGDSGVGKSCLLLRLVEDTYTESFISTIGVDFRRHTATVGGQTFRTNIWDLCGQERFRSITHSYHAAASIVLCFDLSDPLSFANIKRWCGEIERYAPSNTRVILIGTKCDLVLERRIDYETAQDFANTLGIYYLEISARNSINIERLGALIALAPYSQREQHLEQVHHYDMRPFQQNRFGL